MRGRGATSNVANRFDRIEFIPEPECEDDLPLTPTTQYVRDTSKSIIAYNDSPDVGFSASVNPYRGCEHGCIYCYARPTHEFLGFSAGIDFESRIMVKEDAPELLRRELSSRRWTPQVVAMSGVTDCYQPIERRLKLTRKCLEVFLEFRNPVGIVTKNRLVSRDLDVLTELARYRCVVVFVSLTTQDLALNRILEPRTSSPAQRLETMSRLADAGIPVGVMVAPIIPGLTDHEIASNLAAAAKAGAKYAGHVMLRLPYAVAPLFETWLDTHFPDRKDKVLNRVRAMREGKLNDSQFGDRMTGKGPFAEQIEHMFAIGCRKAGLNLSEADVTTDNFRLPISAGDQLLLID